MIVIVGLGNPGERYERTRHNVGFMVLDAMNSQISSDGWDRVKAYDDSTLANLTYAKEPLILFKPGSYVNESGTPVQKLLEDRSIESTDVWVIHDDTEIPLGEVRVKFGGTSGGHNGIRSLDQAIGEGYWRVRVGVGRPDHPEHDLARYVLADFPPNERPLLTAVIDRVAHYLIQSIEQGKLEATTFNAQEKPHQPN